MRTPQKVAGATSAAVLAIAMPLVARWEGYSRDPYRDIAGIWTVCRGETHVEMRRYSDAECDVLFQRAVLAHQTAMLDCLPMAAPASFKAAFVSFGYNVGPTKACASSAARKARAGDFRGACAGLAAWVYAGGKYSAGLANRRRDERRVCELELDA